MSKSLSELGLFRGLGSKLIEQGKIFLNKATPMQKVAFSATTLLEAISASTGLPRTSMYSADSFHHTTDIETWKIIIDSDWGNKKEWLAEIHDCDNFAGSFSSYAADIYLLNSCGRITVELKDPITKKHIGWHRCCIIVDSGLHCWLLETQTDKMIKIEPGKELVIDNWLYIPNYITIN